MGATRRGLSLAWSVYRWLDGENATIERIADPRQAADALGEFIAALQQIDPAGGPDWARAQLSAACRWPRETPHARAIAALAGRRSKRGRDRGVGSGPPGAAWERAARLDPRRSATRGTCWPSRAASAPSSTSVAGRGRSRVRPDARRGSLLRRNAGRCSAPRWRSMTRPGREVAAGPCPSG